MHDKTFIVVGKNRQDRVETQGSGQPGRVDQIEAAGERQERAEIRHNPEQAGRRPPAGQ
ncbi:MAG: hypothetical protein LC700_03415 [Actinobacteria bacterium]|nr:hypothetical protein [Actinomycetota bacterium]